MTSNTRDAIRQTIGKTVVGVMFTSSAALGEEGTECRTLVFDDGTGFTFTSRGSFWIEGKDQVDRFIVINKAKLESAKKDLEGILALANALETDSE